MYPDRRTRSQLMDDHVRLGFPDNIRDLIGIQPIRDHRHGTQVVEHRPL